ncbi:MAG: phosphoribosyltransferase family protein [Cyanobacteria bacterium J06554_1]
MKARFGDRTEAGQRLALQLKIYANRANVVVMALPRGGVPIAYEIAQALNLPLDICLVRKIGEPGHKETAIGAIAADNVRLLNPYAKRYLKIADQTLEEIVAQEQQELWRRERVYRRHCPPLDISDRIVILVDDGLATGATMAAAIMWLNFQVRSQKQLIIAVPIASMAAYKQLKKHVDRLVCLFIPKHLYAIGLWYDNFAQVTDEEVCALLSRSRVVNLTVHRGAS